MKTENVTENRMQVATRITRRTIAVNAMLVVFKMFAGVVAGSAAMISDAVHSITDLVGDFIVLIGVRAARPEPDKDHPYGHERIECIAGILMAILLFGTAVIMGWSWIGIITSGNGQALSAPGILALIAAVVGIAVKEAMYWYIRAGAKKVDSVALMASAWHSRSDAFSSIGSFAGILGARLGFPVLDSVAGLVICLFILKVAVDIFRESLSKMTDKACDDETVEQIRKIALEQEAVTRVDLIKTRVFGDRIYVDMEISADGNASLYQAHDAAQKVHDAIEAAFPKVKHCMIHVNPHSPEL
ncbi:MAG: cation diffusion facilitator family transporter [Oscillospiraceae bacterium]|nr:cation diffusion facilitator family transporter [Oscillospiraceae bacterium]